MNWTEWLADDRLMSNAGVESTWILMLVALVGSLLSSLLISFLYMRFYGGRATGSQIHRAFLLVGPSITAIFISVQLSLPLSLGLLGALSIVRFRMPIKEAEEIGFILLVVAMSLCWATLNVKLAGVLTGVALFGMLLNVAWSWLRTSRGDGIIVITLPAAERTRKADDLLAALDVSRLGGRLDSISSSDAESTISYSFSRLDRAAMLDLRSEVAKIAGDATTSFFFNQSGTAS